MDSDPVDSAMVLQLLDLLESREAELLTWGFVDGGFDRMELEELAQRVLDDAGSLAPVDELVALLEGDRLLFSLPYGGRRVYRTRFGEGVRLFARLRQIFKQDNWKTAPSLVADFRVAIRPRRYPRRDVTIDDAVRQWSETCALGPQEEAALRGILSPAAGGPAALSQFQVRATVTILSAGGDRSKGTMICAGTGTGKTLAFYLPALTTIVTGMQRGRHWTQVLALYPRTELLKDQFTEACVQARKLDGLARQLSGRPVRIGAYYGDTPRRAEIHELDQNEAWRSRGNGFICPFLRCSRCDGEMLWARSDVAAGRERLKCSDVGCDTILSEEEVALTRRSMEERPPEILFTTAEMLNRQMSSSSTQRLLGIGIARESAPWAMLLDEAHTYEGTHGAQVALLIRRWRHAVRAPVHFVGLSATLSDPQPFFAQLVGLPGHAVSVIDASAELEDEGREYQLVLRGDPVSRTALLSTTIQTAMLLARILDGHRLASHGLFGQKVFVFTDDLDVTNRLYHNLLDAEGRNSLGRPAPDHVPLAAFRAPIGMDAAERLRQGQNWTICQQIGHRLTIPPEQLSIGRTSSQDAGVDLDAQVIVATAKLEVGYNDREVGAVLQHKAPHDAAAFLQRKGRGGRPRGMRPWTVVVLSDYGRDRLSYQAYDHLFNPVLEKSPLPVGNRYVLRMQAVFSFFDWMAAQYPSDLRGGSVWTDFSAPAGDEYFQRRQQWAAGFLLRLMDDATLRRSLEDHLAVALQVLPAEVKALLWESPRPLMLGAIPTVQRRLATGWRSQAPGLERDYCKRGSPLPDFVPANLFSDLLVPDVMITAARRFDGNPYEGSLTILQALRHLAPGRVTRRFGLRHISESHWVKPASLTDSVQELPIAQYCELWEELGTFQCWDDGGPKDVACVRPWRMALELSPPTVRNTSNSFPVWSSQIYSLHSGKEADGADGSPFTGLVTSIRFFTHNERCPMKVRRFSHETMASLGMQSGEQRQLHIRYVHDGKPAAVGFEQEVDGIRFGCAIPDSLLDLSDGPALRSCRTGFYRYRVETDPALLNAVGQNRFRLEWISHVFLTALLLEAGRTGLALAQTVERLRGADWTSLVDEVLMLVFQVTDVSDSEVWWDSDEGEDEPEEEVREAGVAAGGGLRDTIQKLLMIPEVREQLLNAASALWTNEGEEWRSWLRHRIKSTLGGALLQACYASAAQHQASDLLLDIDVGPAASGAAPESTAGDGIWISEAIIGGGGVVEEIARRYHEDPRQFYLRAQMALSPSDLDVVDTELTRIIRLSQTDQAVADALAAVRGAATYAELSDAKTVLMRCLRERHIQITHPVMTSLNARVLRPASSAATDELLHELLVRWYEMEVTVGIEVDARIFAYLAGTGSASGDRLAAILGEIAGGSNQAFPEVYGVIYGLLWPRGSLVRERALESYNPFGALPRADPALLRSWLYDSVPSVSVEDSAWLSSAHRALQTHGVVRLSCSLKAGSSLQDALLQTVHEPVDCGFLRLYPYIARVERWDGRLEATLHIREAVQ